LGKTGEGTKKNKNKIVCDVQIYRCAGEKKNKSKQRGKQKEKKAVIRLTLPNCEK
jgi:hypothetical protein